MSNYYWGLYCTNRHYLWGQYSNCYYSSPMQETTGGKKAHANQLISGKFCSLLQSVRLETKSMKWEGVFYWPNKQQQQSNQMNITRLIYYYMNSTTGTLQRLAKHPRLPMSVLEIYFLFCAQVSQPEKPNCITWYLAICLANENHSLTMWLLSSASITEYISSENIWK